MADLQTKYIDLLLLHYPECWPQICTAAPEGTWRDRCGAGAGAGAANGVLGWLAALCSGAARRRGRAALSSAELGAPPAAELRAAS